MLTNTEVTQLVGRIRRAMPRNADVMALCDWAEAAARTPVAPSKPTRAPAGTFDRRAYQRELMRKRRREGKA